jgi:hypothetical protein
MTGTAQFYLDGNARLVRDPATGGVWGWRVCGLGVSVLEGGGGNARLVEDPATGAGCHAPEPCDGAWCVRVHVCVCVHLCWGVGGGGLYT